MKKFSSAEIIYIVVSILTRGIAVSVYKINLQQISVETYIYIIFKLM
ncbi:hypothetical protein CLHUN_15050 [Ruminiclostridium hungatei]|uniref:Uncharacterized protein n=1 Tax=Ruminiclostridium hungatei TaxID=48256 RepID=A0A1V4SKU1_RUMHU|nr:hypothetical protein CLHUN_15050 [Ruminiclostridium hungatei]